MNKDKRVQSKPAQKEAIKRNKFRKYVPSILLFLLFEIVAVTLWLVKKNLFYLLNFSYIGGCLGLGTALFTAGKQYARHFIQLAGLCSKISATGQMFRGRHLSTVLTFRAVPRLEISPTRRSR